MAQDNIKDEILDYKLKLGLLKKKDCTDEENEKYNALLSKGGKLPDNICAYVYDDFSTPTEFFSIIESELTEKEENDFIALKQLGYLKTIKNCILYFTTTSIAGVVIALIAWLANS